ncbi:MAG TPA: hypothetical protein VGS62_09350, partial [Streptosporangiaceae bacterium]|nr:hypothetical protein [Streptosporangiaceae bacterium]
LGNPPYVRHHQIAREWKDWLAGSAARRGLTASRLAGLHVHFFLATAQHAAGGDVGVFITAADWLDVNYGSLVRALLLSDLGGQSLHVLEPSVAAFPDATVTSAITCFLPGSRPAALRLRRAASIASLDDLGCGSLVSRATLGSARTWGPLLNGSAPGPADGGPDAPERATAPPEPSGRGRTASGPAVRGWGGGDPASLAARRGGARRAGGGQVELGELCRVHRGQVTGANAVWVRGRDEADVPARFRFAAVTRARELFQAAGVLSDTDSLRVVIDLPADLDVLDGGERELVAAFLDRAARAGAANTYIARHRRRWWRVGLAEPAPILATYMARRPPAFVRNPVGVRHLNIAHGLYPREPWPGRVLDRLAAYLSDSVTVGQGRTYAGGLTKFEPGEMERLTVPWEQIRSSC